MRSRHSFFERRLEKDEDGLSTFEKLYWAPFGFGIVKKRTHHTIRKRTKIGTGEGIEVVSVSNRVVMSVMRATNSKAT